MAQREVAPEEQRRALRAIIACLPSNMYGKDPKWADQGMLETADVAGLLDALQTGVRELAFYLGMLHPKALQLDSENSRLKEENGRLQMLPDQCSTLRRLLNKSIDQYLAEAPKP